MEKISIKHLGNGKCILCESTDTRYVQFSDDSFRGLLCQKHLWDFSAQLPPPPVKAKKSKNGKHQEPAKAAKTN